MSAEPHLEASLSPSYPRAFLTRGGAGWAAMAAPPAADVSGLLGFGLIWLDYLRRREHRVTVSGLALFVPRGREQDTAWRLRKLNPRAAEYALFTYEDGREEPADPADIGNLDTRVEPMRRPVSDDWRLERLGTLGDVEAVATREGAWSWRVRGLEFARWEDGRLSYGVDRKRPAESDAHWREIEALAAELARVRHPDAGHGHPLWQRAPEKWLESRVRAEITAIDAHLLAAPVYGQVPAMAGGDRGVIDLVAVDDDGRPAVLELKASEDLHLPLQALDYWLRVSHHLACGDFTARGYFPGIELRDQPPRLYLVAPALDFHPTTETILRYFSPEIEVERVGLHADWRSRIKPVFRLAGARRPG